MAIIQQLRGALTDNQAFISNVKQLMQKQNIREAGLSRLTGIPLTTLHKILSGKTSDPRISTLQTLANYFEVTVDELYTGVQNTNIQSIPILSWGDCTKDTKFLKSLTPSNWGEWLTTEHIAKFAYGLISKPSMEPRFPKGTTLIVDPSLTPEDGDLVIVVYNSITDATIRQLSDDGPNRYLISFTPNEPKERLSNDIRIISVVVESKFSWSDKK